MVVSGVVLSLSYSRYVERTSNSERPSLLTKITEPEVELLTADGEERNLQDLKGKVTLALTLPMKGADDSRPSLAALREVMDHFSGKEEQPSILVFVLDGTNTEPREMAGVLAEYGNEPEVMRVVANQDGKSSLRSFSKTKMRFNITPTGADGDFDYDTSIVLLDQHLHVRGHPGAPRAWDFERVAGFEKAYEEAKISNPDDELTPPPMTTEQLRKLLIQSIEYLYANPNEKGQK